MERRYNHRLLPGIEFRQDESGGTTITGMGAVFYEQGERGTEFELWPGVVERIMPGAFSGSMDRGDDVRGLFNHDPSAILGRTSSGTMRLEQGAAGLRYSIDMPDTQVGRDVLESVKRGDLSGSSFSFLVANEEWKKDGDIEVREITGVELFDTGPVTFPAYVATNVQARSKLIDIATVQAYNDWRQTTGRNRINRAKLRALLLRA